MVEPTKELSSAELSELVKQFQAITDDDQKAKFYHANPALHFLFRGVHFPKSSE